MQTTQNKSPFKNAFGQESTETHRHVARDWQKQCKPVDEILRRLRDREEDNEDVWMDGCNIRLDEGFCVDSMKLTGLALNGLLRFTNVPLAMVLYLRERGFGPEAAMHLNREFKSLGDRQFLVRTTLDGQGKRYIRAFCSSRYAPLSNADTLQLVMEAFPRGSTEDLLTCHLEDDGDSFRAMILAPDYVQSYEDSDYGVGVSLQNSEVGLLPILVESLTFRSCCRNGHLHGSQGHGRLSRKHQGTLDLDELRASVRQTVAEALDHGRDAVKTIQSLKSIQLQDTERVIVLLARENALDKDESKAWMKGVEHTLEEPHANWEGTAFTLIQGLTRSARDTSGIQRANLERLATKMMSPSRQASEFELRVHWGRISERAESVSTKSVAVLHN